MKLKPTKSQKGIIAVDFLFAFILVSGFGFALLSLTLTLSVVELTQYITYSSARTYMAAHRDVEQQKQLGREKYAELINHPVFAPFYKNGWFQVNDVPNIGDQSQNPLETARYERLNDQPYQFFGVNTGFTAHVLQFRIPLYGSTTGTDDSTGNFTTVIGSYLNREPSLQECQENFNRNRWRTIRQNQGSAASTYTSDGGYTAFMDNGC